MMPIHVLGEKDLRDSRAEVLVVELDYGKGGIIDSSRISIETSIEYLFQGWLGTLLQLDSDAAPESLRADIGAFREAQKFLIELAPRNYALLFPYYISTRPGFVLVDVEHGSYKKYLVGALMIVVLPIFPQLIADRVSHHLDQAAPAATTCVVVPTQSSLREFVSYIGTIQNDIDASPDALVTYRTLIKLYSELALLPNGKLTYSVLLKGNVTVTFEVTSDQARHDLPLLIEKAANYHRKR